MPIQRAKPRIIDLDQTPLTSVSSTDMPAGTVVQAKYFTHSTTGQGTSTSYVDQFSCDFTPTAAGNSIWQHIQWTDLWEGSEHNVYRLVDDTGGAETLLSWDAQQSASTSGWATHNRSINDLLTNCLAQTYTFRLQTKGVGGSTNYWFCYGQGNGVGNPPAQWTIMEIKG
tara:strand:+ start:13233 stop:13742 length:510 start_codon:yes stop_codon:yes gene_type:complete